MRKILPLFVFLGIIILILGFFVAFPLWIGGSILSILFMLVIYSEFTVFSHKATGDFVLRTNGKEIKATSYIFGFLFLGYFVYELYINDISSGSFFFLIFPMHALMQTIAHAARKKYKPVIYLLEGDTLFYYDLTIKKYDVQKLKELKFHPRRKLLQLSFTDATSLVVECTAFDFTELRTFFETLTEKSGLDIDNFLKQEDKGLSEV